MFGWLMGGLATPLRIQNWPVHVEKGSDSRSGLRTTSTLEANVKNENKLEWDYRMAFRFIYIVMNRLMCASIEITKYFPVQNLR